jgi:hypothetical protein
LLGRRSAGSGAACTHRGAIDGVKPAGRFFPGLVVCVVCGDPIGNKSCLRGGYVDLSITDHVTHQPLQPQPVPAQRRGPAGVLQIVWSRCALRWNLRLLIKKTQPLVTYFSGKKSLRLNAICGAKTNGIMSELGQTEKHSERTDVFRSSPENGRWFSRPKRYADRTLWKIRRTTALRQEQSFNNLAQCAHRQ